MTIPMVPSLREIQRDGVASFLRLAEQDMTPGSPTELSLPTPASSSATAADPLLPQILTSAPVWKVLILDAHTQKIISTIMKVNDLRALDVTLFLQIEANRSPIEDVPVVYFVEPTEVNIKRILKDMESRLYEKYYVHFASFVSRDLLEELAQGAVQLGQEARFARLTDQYLDYVSLEDDLFTLNLTDTYYRLHAPGVSESEIGDLYGRMARGLLSVTMSLGAVPVIRYERAGSGSLLEALAGPLETRLRDHSTLVQTLASPLPQGGPSDADERADLLVLLDRSCDLASPLRHKWSYGSLVYDTFDVQLNRIQVVEQDEETKQLTKKSYDIDAKDAFWRANHALPFPQVAENVDAELKQYRKDMERMTHQFAQTTAGSATGPSSENVLKSALTVMPSMTEQKRLIDVHMNVAMSILNVVKARQLDQLYSLEQQPMSKVTKRVLLDRLAELGPAVEPIDKLRLALVYLLHALVTARPALDDWAAADWERLESLVLATAADDRDAAKKRDVITAILRYFQSLCYPGGLPKGSIGRIGHAAATNGGNTGADAGEDSVYSAASNVIGRMGSFLSGGRGNLEERFSGVLDNLMSGMKNLLLLDAKESPLLRCLDALCMQLPYASVVQARSASVTECALASSPATSSQPGSPSGPSMAPATSTYVQRDPRSISSAADTSVPASPAGQQRRRLPRDYRNIIVFIVGGVTFDEYQLLRAYLQSSYKQARVTIGATEIINAPGLLNQFERLGSQL